ncbi:MAG: helix-turn-helix domain-containing protein, partial [Myxococcales bacterium]|nr:helix-turn-helix domain-containing protein [Myxococcales bacterium]
QLARSGVTLTLQQAAGLLNVHHNTVRRLIARGILPASQPVRYAPWTIEAAHLKLPAVREELARGRTPSHHLDDSQLSMFSKV